MSHADNILNILKRVKPRLSARYGVDTLALFGSIVRDDFSDQSDIDIMVTFNKPIGIEFVNLANDLEQELHRKVDLVSRKAIKPRYLDAIANEIVYV